MRGEGAVVLIVEGDRACLRVATAVSPRYHPHRPVSLARPDEFAASTPVVPSYVDQQMPVAGDRDFNHTTRMPLLQVETVAAPFGKRVPRMILSHQVRLRNVSVRGY